MKLPVAVDSGSLWGNCENSARMGISSVYIGKALIKMSVKEGPHPLRRF